MPLGQRWKGRQQSKREKQTTHSIRGLWHQRSGHAPPSNRFGIGKKRTNRSQSFSPIVDVFTGDWHVRGRQAAPQAV